MRLGTIHSLELKNFMVYSRCEFRPSQGFNLIIGPNGSGKSALLIAIVIGLGGDVADIGRQKRLADLVNEQAQEDAEITIRLNWDCDKKHVIRCVIRRETGDAEYFLNDHPADQDYISGFVEKVNINPKNMCQFLPQERVSKFPTMTSVELFRHTLKSIGSDDSIEAMAKFKDKMETIKTINEQINSVETKIEKALRDLASKKPLEDAIRKHSQAKSIKSSLEILLSLVKLKREQEAVASATKKIQDLDKGKWFLNAFEISFANLN